MKGYPSSVKGVVLDTNMLLVPYQFGVDVLEEIQRLIPGVAVYTIPQVVKEIEKLSRGRLHERLGAKIAKRLLEKIEILPVGEELPADRALIELSRKGYVVATNDRELRRKIREVGGYTIFLREKNHLEMD